LKNLAANAAAVIAPSPLAGEGTSTNSAVGEMNFNNKNTANEGQG
jgi:hypothetical protein